MKSSATFSRWSTRLYALTSVLCFGVLLLLGSSASGQALSGIVGLTGKELHQVRRASNGSSTNAASEFGAFG